MGASCVVGAAAAWAFIGVFTRELGARGVEASDVATWRALLGGACFVLHRLVVGGDRPTRRDAGPLTLFAIVGVTVFFAALPLAVEAGGITIAYVLLYTAPAWVALGAVILLGERLGPWEIGLVGATVAGAALVALSGGANVIISAASIGWGLAAGWSYASYYLLGRRLFDRLGAVTTYAICLPTGGAILALLVRPSVPPARSWPWLVGLAILSTWLPYVLLAAGLARLPSSRAVVIATIEPVLAALLGAALYDERLGSVGWIGAAIVFSSAAASARSSSQRSST
jgi:drug/metabolite transporter (DMT)-like permease